MWSLGAHSLKLKGPLATGGALFSGALSRLVLASFGSMYLPKTLFGMISIVPICVRAGQKELASVTVIVLPWTLMPETSLAAPLMKSCAPTIWSTLFLWSVFLL